MPDKKRRKDVFFAEFGASGIEIRSDLVYCRIGQIDRTDFSSFSTDTELTSREIDGSFIECGQFGNTQARRIDALDNRRVAFSLERFRIDLCEYPCNFLCRQKSDFAIFLLDEVE